MVFRCRWGHHGSIESTERPSRCSCCPQNRSFLGGSSPFPIASKHPSFSNICVISRCRVWYRHRILSGFSTLSWQLGSGVMNSKGSKSAVSFLQSHGCQSILGYFGYFYCLCCLFVWQVVSFKDGLFTAATDDPKWQVAHRVLISPFSVRGLEKPRSQSSGKVQIEEGSCVIVFVSLLFDPTASRQHTPSEAHYYQPVERNITELVQIYDKDRYNIFFCWFGRLREPVALPDFVKRHGSTDPVVPSPLSIPVLIQ